VEYIVHLTLLYSMRLEKLDIVNDRDEIVGQDTRHAIHTQGLWHREIHVIIYNSRGEILLQKRSHNSETFKGVWDLGVGGHVEPGDSYEYTACKETQEETGLVIEEADLEFVEKIKKRSHDVMQNFYNNVFDAVYAYRYDGSIELLRREEAKIDELRFWSVEDMKRSASHHEPLMEMLIQEPWASVIEKARTGGGRHV
jgi:isopentenyldiphosphate isomerase